MIDAIYLVGSMAFFALMLAYVAACDHLGRPADTEPSASEQR